jgi:hypothetical protein
MTEINIFWVDKINKRVYFHMNWFQINIYKFVL